MKFNVSRGYGYNVKCNLSRGYAVYLHVPPEHSRYLHAHLDSPLASLQPDRDYPPQFKDNWVRMLPFTFEVTYPLPENIVLNDEFIFDSS